MMSPYVPPTFKDVPFSTEDKYGCDPATIDTALSEATRYLDNQVASIANTRQSAALLVSILSAVLAALAGVALTIPESLTYCMLFFVSSIIPLSILLSSVFYKKTIYFSGDSPSHYMTPEYIQWAQSMKEHTSLGEDSLLKLAHLDELQFRIMKNKETKESLVRYYRLALMLMMYLYTLSFVIISIHSITVA